MNCVSPSLIRNAFGIFNAAGTLAAGMFHSAIHTSSMAACTSDIPDTGVPVTVHIPFLGNNIVTPNLAAP